MVKKWLEHLTISEYFRESSRGLVVRALDLQPTGPGFASGMKKGLFKTVHAGMILSGVSCKEIQELDVSEELTFTTGCRDKAWSHRPPYKIHASKKTFF